MNFVELRDSRPEELGAAADAWVKLSQDLAKLEERTVHDLTGALKASGWAGGAADAALGIMDRTDDEFELASLQARNLAAVLRQAMAEFQRLHQQLLSAIDAATTVLELRVDDQGLVHAPGMTYAERHDPDYLKIHRFKQQNAAIYEELIASILKHATDADLQYNELLRAYAPHFTGQMLNTEWNDASADAQAALKLTGFNPDSIPKPGGDPAAAAAWWKSLTDDQRALVSTAYPAQVGALDGLPTPARGEANKLALRDLIGAPDLRTYDNDKTDPQYQRLIKLLGKLEDAETGPPAQQLYLLGIDNQGDGKAIVAVGNPDTARHTAVMVPGVNTELDDMAGQINKAAALRQTSDDLTYGVDGDVAVIAWLGYDTPGISDAMSGSKADAGAPALDSFINGLHTAHDSSPQHMTVVGHSYGSAVIGTAASHGDGLAVDDIITAGSPGMRADNASQLQIDPHHVWAGAAQGDDVSGWMSHFAHGTEPHADEFGANRYHVDTQGHSAYWSNGSESLTNQARIVVGFYDQVTLDHGSPPP